MRGRLCRAALLAAALPATLAAAGDAAPTAVPDGLPWAWVAFGFAGQALFGARFLVQWLATERAQRVVVPVAFWWLSLAGGVVLLVYYVRRLEPVGVVGQLCPLAIYVRNLVIHRRSGPSANDGARRVAGASRADGA